MTTSEYWLLGLVIAKYNDMVSGLCKREMHMDETWRMNLRVGDLEGDWVGDGVGDVEGLVLGLEVGIEVMDVDGAELGDRLGCVVGELVVGLGQGLSEE